jgi:sugar phosphate isomerase/epimerase
MHLGQGVNLANTDREKKNLRSLKLSVEMADYFSSKIIVVHPGERENADCNVQNSAWLFRRMADKRILVENMPFIDGPDFFCRTPEEVAAFMKLANCGFCLDIGHATAAATGLGLNYIEHIKNFLALRPSYFHLQDTPTDLSHDQHLHFGEGGMDLPRIFKMLPKDAMLCLETANDIEGRLKDIIFLKENI